MPEQGRVTAEDVMRGVAKLGFGGRGIIGNCARPEREWQQVRKRLDAMFREALGFVRAVEPADWDMHMKATGYALQFGRWTMFGCIPTDTRPEHPTAKGTPQVVMNKPRSVDEAAFVYALLEKGGLYLQMGCERRWIFPKGVSPADFERSEGFPPGKCRYVQVASGEELLAFYRQGKKGR